MRHLHESARRALEQPESDRIRCVHEPRWIGYRAAKTIHDQLNELLQYPKVHRMPNLLIFGKTNNGKTALINRFCQTSGINNDPSLDAAVLPVLLIQAPPVPDERRFYISLLDHVGIVH